MHRSGEPLIRTGCLKHKVDDTYDLTYLLMLIVYCVGVLDVYNNWESVSERADLSDYVHSLGGGAFLALDIPPLEREAVLIRVVSK